MTPQEILETAEQESKIAENYVQAVEKSKSWPDQATNAKKALRHQQNSVSALIKLVKGAVSAN